MCLAVYTNGWAEGRSKCISVYVHLMQGNFDDKLEWPFRGVVHVQLLSWEGEEDVKGSAHTRVIPFDESAQILKCTAAGRVVGGERPEIGRGLCKCLAHRYSREVLKKHVYTIGYSHRTSCNFWHMENI